MPALDQLAVVGVGLRAVDDAVDPLAVGRTEDFLGGDVGNELNAALGLAGRAFPSSVIGEADGQVGAVGARHTDAVEVQRVHVVAAGFCHSDMLLPRADGVAGGDAADVKDQCPELFDGLVNGQVGENLGRPARRGYGGDAPLDAVVHRVLLPRLHEGAAGKVDAVQLARIQPGQCLRVFGVDGQCAAAVRVFGIVEVAAQLVGLHGDQVVLGGHFHMQAGQLVVLPADNDALGTGLIARADAGMGEVWHRDRAADDKILARADIDAHLDDKISVKLEVVLVHGAAPFILYILFVGIVA